METLRRAGCVFAEDEAAILIEAVEDQPGGDCRTDAEPDPAADSDPASVSEFAVSESVGRRVAGEPLEQIVGWVDFAGLRLHMRPGIFVPRQRTRQLAELSVLAVRDRLCGPGAKMTAPKFLEAFCGIAPVASVVSDSVPGAEVHFGDDDIRALETATHNARGTAHNLDCLNGLPYSLRHNIDVIAAVPPYVPDGAARFLPHEAVDYEPAAALFGGNDGLDFVRRLIAETPEGLRPDGTLLIELGHGQATEISDRAGMQGWATQAHLGEDGQTVVLELNRRN